MVGYFIPCRRTQFVYIYSMQRCSSIMWYDSLWLTSTWRANMVDLRQPPWSIRCTFIPSPTDQWSARVDHWSGTRLGQRVVWLLILTTIDIWPLHRDAVFCAVTVHVKGVSDRILWCYTAAEMENLPNAFCQLRTHHRDASWSTITNDCTNGNYPTVLKAYAQMTGNGFYLYTGWRNV